MSEVKQEPKVAGPTASKEQLAAHLKAQTDAALKFEGKPNRNPHYFIVRVIQPALNALASGKYNAAEILAIKFTEDQADTGKISVYQTGPASALLLAIVGSSPHHLRTLCNSVGQ